MRRQVGLAPARAGRVGEQEAEAEHERRPAPRRPARGRRGGRGAAAGRRRRTPPTGTAIWRRPSTRPRLLGREVDQDRGHAGDRHRGGADAGDQQRDEQQRDRRREAGGRESGGADRASRRSARAARRGGRTGGPAAISATAGPTPVAPNRKANSTVLTPRSSRSAKVSAGRPNCTSEIAICDAIATEHDEVTPGARGDTATSPDTPLA